MTRKRTHREIEKIVNEMGYVLLDDYTDNKKRIKIIINSREGYKWEGIFSSLMNHDGNVNFFDVRNRFTLNNIHTWLNINRSEVCLCEGNIYEGSVKKLKFFHNISDCQEEFWMSWNNLSRGQGCAVCSGHQVGKRTSLAHLHPALAKEWHRDNKVSSEEVSVSSGVKVYWICSKCGYGENKEWATSTAHRTSGRGCPACAGKVVTDKNRLSVLFPKISQEWDYNKNTDSPEDVSFGLGEKRWWICPKGHEYYSLVCGRVRGRGCKKCSNSKGEGRILSWVENNILNLKDIGVISHTPEKTFMDCRDKRELPFDFGFEYKDEIWSLIEFYGKQHFSPVNFSGRGKEFAKKEFKDQIKKDKIKQKYCVDNKIPLLIIPYWEFDNIEKILEQTFFR